MTSSSPPRCPLHPGHTAVARCTRCARPVCHRCHGSDLRGFCVCSTCRAALKIRPGTPWDDPESDSAAEAFVQTSWEALRSPQRFFERLSPSAPALPAALFGLSAIALGVTAQTLWQMLLTEDLIARVNQLIGLSLPSRLIKAMLLARVVAVAPFVLAMHTILLNASIKLFGGRARLKLTARITGYGAAAFLFELTPPLFGLPLGQVLMIIWLYQLELAGVQRYSGLERPRAMLATLSALLMSILLGLF